MAHGPPMRVQTWRWRLWMKCPKHSYNLLSPMQQKVVLMPSGCQRDRKIIEALYPHEPPVAADVRRRSGLLKPRSASLTSAATVQGHKVRPKWSGNSLHEARSSGRESAHFISGKDQSRLTPAA